MGKRLFSYFILDMFFALLVFMPSAFAYPRAWGPFDRDEKPELFPVSECHEIKTYFCEDTTEFIKKCGVVQEQPFSLKIRAGGEGVFVSVAEGEGKLRLNNKKVMKGDFSNSLFFPPVLTGDFNKDGVPDFVVPIWHGGLGLASSGYEMIFVISDGESYKITSFYDMSLSKKSFVDLRGDGSCQYVHTSFVFGGSEPSRIDGRKRNFWVYNLLEIRGSQIIANNEIDSRFPKWVWFMHGPNHKDTIHLTGEQKERLWAEHLRSSGRSRTFLLRR